jgi:hypothetical protein
VKVFELRDAEGKVFAFEVDAALGRRGLCRLVSKISGVRLLAKPRLFSWFKEEAFCSFQLGGVTFEALEPFGDNSRYWVGPKPVQFAPQINLVRAAFERHTPLLDRSVLRLFKSAG